MACGTLRTSVSERHPIIAVTGSSGAGTSTARAVFAKLFASLGLNAAEVAGDCFHAYTRDEMATAIERARIRGENFSHFGPAANHMDRLEALFRDYSEHGRGDFRHYIHNEIEAEALGAPVGHFTPWQATAENTDLLLYEGLHGGVITDRVNVAQYVDLLIGMTPTINLEWVQKIHRDTADRGHAPSDVARTILRRMPDYVNYITPQFSRTDINFQRVPLVDTSNPFAVKRVPTAAESYVVIHFADSAAAAVDFGALLDLIPRAFMPRQNTIVAPGEHMSRTMQLVLEPLIRRLMHQRRRAVAGGTEDAAGAEQAGRAPA